MKNLVTITKRDGREVPFDLGKITNAIHKAFVEQGSGTLLDASELANKVLAKIRELSEDTMITVEGIQDLVEVVLIESGNAKVAKAYILYREKRQNIRESKSDLMDAVGEIIAESNRDNANVGNSPSAKLLQIAEAACKSYYTKRMLPPNETELHLKGDIHIHDLSWYGKTLTCIQIPLAKLLLNGFDTGKGYIRTPKSIKAAGALSAIIMQSTQNDMHGGISFGFYDRDMAVYVEREFIRQEKIIRKIVNRVFEAKLGVAVWPDMVGIEGALVVPSVEETNALIEKMTAEAVQNETWQAMEGFVYNLNSMHSRAGAQIPFSSINLGTDTSRGGRMITENFLKAYEKGLGKGEAPIFPNVCFKVKEGVSLNPGDPNYDLFQLAMQVACKRLQPNFSFQDSSFNKPFSDVGEEVAYMGCRTRVIANVNGEAVTDGRGNLSFTTINLPRLGIKAKGDMDKFWRSLEERINDVIFQLKNRYNVQKRLKVKDFPFLMGEHLYMDSEELGPDDPIEVAIKNGTLSCGFVGLAECLKALTGKHHGESLEAQELGLQIISKMRTLMDQASEQYGLNYTLLATPAESVAGRLVKIDKKEFGIIDGVTDKEWYTNSYHVPVEYETTISHKITMEGPYHKFCNAGHISYVELPSAPYHNIAAFEQILKKMREADMGYAAVNFPVDNCRECGFNGVIEEDNCPKCGSGMISRVRRITGYLSTLDMFNPSKKAEVAARKTHK